MFNLASTFSIWLVYSSGRVASLDVLGIFCGVVKARHEHIRNLDGSRGVLITRNDWDITGEELRKRIGDLGDGRDNLKQRARFGCCHHLVEYLNLAAFKRGTSSRGAECGMLTIPNQPFVRVIQCMPDTTGTGYQLAASMAGGRVAVRLQAYRNPFVPEDDNEESY
ncbi:hypothetical protein FB451DRAFT_1372534 [Mycena latifolia]|nr:hypothetical protein FB451DRAFT_1372534 [Mycena latifolia]